ncbi:hypothetical protein NP493_29g07026 [Ridgeia piscesae]|uniref:Amiloride-sensitive sodium channel n=1 Tax=Ridgeia piscesae TaxID=27915 RepID=A0AAD9UKE5_RIDPI|nr:hypothetical protein NP493_29g07026 [Ridgeia piscesae]
MHTFVGVTVSKETNLPPPYGDCMKHGKLRYFDRYSQAACYRECITDFVVAMCGCRDFYMPPFNTDVSPVCSLSQYTTCLLPAIESLNTNLSASCVCPPACDIVHYKSSMSYATANENTKSQLDVSEEFLKRKAAADLERLHESYINRRPLTNYTATPNGDYDALYRTTELFRQTTEINQTRNILQLNIYMRNLRVQEYNQLKAYTLKDLLSDIGGSMGLLIGASVITLFEALDACAIALASRRRKKTRRRRRPSQQETETEICTLSTRTMVKQM